MLNRKRFWYFHLLLIVISFFFQTSALAYDITEKFSIAGALAGAYQHQTGDDIDDKGRGAIPFQPGLSLRPTENDDTGERHEERAKSEGGFDDCSHVRSMPRGAELRTE